MLCGTYSTIYLLRLVDLLVFCDDFLGGFLVQFFQVFSVPAVDSYSGVPKTLDKIIYRG